MGSFVINAKNTSDKTGTIIPDRGFKYSSILNQINEAHITISGMGTIDRELIEMGSEVYIYRKNTLKFRGIIDNYNSLAGGAVVIHASGFEKWLAMENGAYASSPWKATASATIFTSVLGESTKLNAGTIEAGTNIDFRLSKTDSLWSATTNLLRKTTQDISMDYTTTPPEISILDHTGSSSSVAVLNAGIEMTDPRVTHAYPLGNKIIVYGKGDGTNQITGTAQDATSIAAYGTITRTVIDRSIMSSSEANTLAAAELALTKDITKIYDFDIVNPDMSIVLGDHVTLNAPDLDLTSEEVRVVGIDRGERQGREYMTLQVTNPAYKQNIRKKNLVMAGINKRLQDSNSFMQGATNVWGDTQLLNANSTEPLILRFYVPANIEDEAGNTQINDVKLSYTSKDYRTFAGSLTGSTGNASTGAGMTNASSTSGAGITNASATSGAGITNASATSGAGITNAIKGASDAGYFFGGYSQALTGDNSWRSVGTSINIGNLTYLFHGITGSFSVPLYSSSWITNGQEYYIRAKNTTDTSYYPSSTGFKIHAGVSANGYGMMAVPFYLHIPENWTNKNYELQYKISNQTLWSSTGLVQTVWYNYHGSQGHTHSNSFNDSSHTNNNTFNDSSHTNNNTFNDASHTNNNTFNDAQHTNPAGTLNADYSLGETGTSATDTQIKIYNSAGTLLWDSGNRGQIEEQDIDISSYITANDWYRIEIYPNSDALTYGTVYLKGGVDS